MMILWTEICKGRFSDPEQDRMIALCEAALLQSLPRAYGEKLNRCAVSKMIGDVVPPKLAEVPGEAIIDHVENHG